MCRLQAAMEQVPETQAARSQVAAERAATRSRGDRRAEGSVALPAAAGKAAGRREAAAGGERGRGRRGRVSPHPRAAAGASPAAAAAAHRACGSLNNSHAHREEEGAPPKRGPRLAASALENTRGSRG